MQLYYAPLFSGSSGNSVLVGDGETFLLVDAGVSCSRIMAELKAIGIDPARISAILVTHEHSDHVTGIGPFARRFGCDIYATQGTWSAMESKLGSLDSSRRHVIGRDTDFYLNGLNIRVFPTPHDAAESAGYVISDRSSASFAVATDVGCVRSSWFDAVRGADAVLLESNYDDDMLMAGPYPYELKHRIRSRNGHLSNSDAAGAALSLFRSGTRHVILGHLSKENNFPELALTCTRSVLKEAGLEEVRLSVAERDHNSGLYALEAALMSEVSE